MDKHSLSEAALTVFRAPPDKLNCCQSVVHAHQVTTGTSPVSVADCKPFGGGRAPEGICGALHGACLAQPERAVEITEAFKAKLGATTCHDLKRELKVPCEDCVSVAAALLAKD
jgi:hypothetical protein